VKETAEGERWRMAYADVDAEVGRAEEYWGGDHDLPDAIWLSVLAEEVGEAAKEIHGPWPRELTTAQKQALYHELAQVAAVAVRWMVRLNRGEEVP
jgi:hypothetical protein